MKNGKLKKLLKKINPVEWFRDCPVYIAPLPRAMMCDPTFDYPLCLIWSDPLAQHGHSPEIR